MLAATVVIAADGPPWIVYTIVAPRASSRRRSDRRTGRSFPGSPELRRAAAANVVTSVVLSVGGVVGPMIGALVLAVERGGGLRRERSVVRVSAAVIRVRAPEQVRPASRATNPLGHEVAAGLGTLFRHPDLRFLSGLYVAQTLVAGSLSIFVVLTSIELTGKGDSWVGVLNAALGVGGLFGGAVALGRVARQRLAADFGIGLALFGGPLALVALVPEAWPAAVCFAGIGGQHTGRRFANTLLQRTVADGVLSRAFGALQSLLLAAVGIGAMVAPLLVNALGTKGALVATGVVLPALSIVSWARLRAIDHRVAAPEGTAVLRRADACALPEPQIERLAAASEEVRVRAGDVVFREGDAGDRFYVIEEGEVEIAGKTFGPASRSARSRSSGTCHVRPALRRVRMSCCERSVARTSWRLSPRTIRPRRPRTRWSRRAWPAHPRSRTV